MYAGYYSRHSALRQLLMSFLKTAHAAGSESQVLSLGAGFDTTWFQLNQDSPELLPTRYLEVDFPEVRACMHGSRALLFCHAPWAMPPLLEHTAEGRC